MPFCWSTAFAPSSRRSRKRANLRRHGLGASWSFSGDSGAPGGGRGGSSAGGGDGGSATGVTGVKDPGLFEAPFGLTLRQAIDNFGGGMLPGSQFAFALTGGAAGTIVSSNLLDIPIDYASAAKGISLGAGAFLICDQSVSVVAFLRELLRFFTIESCGKCNCQICQRSAASGRRKSMVTSMRR